MAVSSRKPEKVENPAMEVGSLVSVWMVGSHSGKTAGNKVLMITKQAVGTERSLEQSAP